MMSKNRKWNDDYVRFGFTCKEKAEDLQNPQCILCDTVLSNSNLKPSSLQKHFNNVHGGADVTRNDVGSLKVKRARFDS